MLFNSIEFLYFFLVVTSLFFILPHRFRWSLLLAASCFFYMLFKPEYILILIFTIVVDYFAGILLENEHNEGKKRKYLIMSLVANIGVLAVFKYYNFLNDNVTGLATLFGCKNHIPAFTWVLPLGLSFHTFQAMSYTIEVYQGNQKAERHFGIYALYVMFYPQLVAGPIERPQNIVHQFHEKKYFNYDNAVLGLNLIVYGLFKKIVVADRLSVYVNQVYGHLQFANSISVFLAMVFFTIQIYADFSGYSDIARGTAKFMGYELMVNFDRPLLSSNLSEFWRRWHISLSTWFNDYLYLPLVAKWRNLGNLSVVFAVIITFLFSGLWHGAAWRFVVYGALHGAALAYEILTKKKRKKLFKNVPKRLMSFVGGICTFSYVCFTFIFFRAESFTQAGAIIKKLFEGSFSLNMVQLTAEKGPLSLMFNFLVIGLLALSYRLPSDLKLKRSLWFIILGAFTIIILGKNVESEFIYFQF